MPLIARINLWLTALLAWGCFAVISVTIFWNFAVGYSWALPLIGTLKGPPPPFQKALITTIILLAALIGFGVSFIVLLKGRWLQRLSILIPLLLSLGVLGAMTYQAVGHI